MIIELIHGYSSFAKISRKYGISDRDVVILLSKDEPELNGLLLTRIDESVRCHPNRKVNGVYIITDDSDIAGIDDKLENLFKTIIPVATKILTSIIYAYCAYTFTDHLYIGKANGLQGRSGINSLVNSGVSRDEIIKYGILYPGYYAGKSSFPNLSNILHLVVFGIYGSLGKSVYKTLNRRYNFNDKQVFIYDYKGIGDVYILSSFLLEYEKENNVEAFLLVEGDSCRRVAQLCGVQHAISLSAKEMKMLVYYARLPGPMSDKLRVITPFPHRINTDIYSAYLYGRRINLAEAYRCVAFNLDKMDHGYPVAPVRSEVIRSFFQSNGLMEGNTVIISPHANTVSTFAYTFWYGLANRLKEDGYDVCTNVCGDEYVIEGTKKVTFDLEDAEHILSGAGYFVGIRSGFCDVICNSTAYKCILYPDYEMFNSSLYDFCSFEKMGFGQNIEEICWPFERYEELTEKVVYGINAARENKGSKGL